MKKFIILLVFLLVSSISFSQNLCDEDICVVEFNAGFNKANSVDWLDKLGDCGVMRVDIQKSPDLQKEHNQSYDLQIDLSFLFFSDKFLHSLIMLLIYEEATWKDIKNKYNLNNKQLADAKKEVIKWISTAL